MGTGSLTHARADMTQEVLEGVCSHEKLTNPVICDIFGYGLQGFLSHGTCPRDSGQKEK